MSNRTSIAISSRVVNPDGSPVQDRQLLVFEAGETIRPARRVVAVLDGDDKAVAVAREILVTNLGREAPAARERQQETHVRNALAEVSRRVSSRVDLSLTLVIWWTHRRIMIGQLGRGRVHLYQVAGSGIEDVVPASLGLDESNSRVAELSVGPTDCLVLLGTQIACRVTATEILETVAGSTSIADAATWLASLASARDARQGVVTIVQLGAKDELERPLLLRLESDNQPRSLVLVGLGVLTGIVVLVAAGLLVSHAFSRAPAARAAPAPLGLRVAHTSYDGALLAWAAVPSATGYRVTVGSQSYRTNAPRLVLSHALQPRSRYPWRVRAMFGKKIGPPSPAASLQTPALRSLPVLRAFNVRRVYPASQARHIPLCWRTTLIGQRFELYVVGGRLHLHRTLTAANLSRSSGNLCVSQALRPGVNYGWRIGPHEPGYVPAWAPWQYFWIAARKRPAVPIQVARAPTVRPAAPPIPTPTAVVPAPVYRVPTPTPVYQAPAPQPQPVYRVPTPQPQPAPAQAPPVQPAPAPVVPAPTQAPAPAPTSPVQVCSNPPNCG